MALIPSIALILGSLAEIPLRGRRAQTVSMVSAGLALVACMILFQRLPEASPIPLWRPIEVFGPSFLFSLDEQTWPFLLLASAVAMAEALLHGRSAVRLFYAGTALAAIAGGNLLTVAMLWTVMIAIETTLRFADPAKFEHYLRKTGLQFAAVASLVAAAYFNEWTAELVALAALIRGAGGENRNFPLGLATLPAIGALAALSRTSVAVQVAASIVLLVILAKTLFVRSNITRLAVATVAVGLLAPPASQDLVFITVAGVLVAIVGLSRTRYSRFAWAVVTVVPTAFFVSMQPWIAASIAAVGMGGISILLRREKGARPLGRREVAATGLLLVAAAMGTLLSGWWPNLGGLLTAIIGLSLAFGITRLQSTLSAIELPSTRWLQRAGTDMLHYVAGAVRTSSEVLEGESAVLWILLVLLVVVIGLRAMIL